MARIEKVLTGYQRPICPAARHCSAAQLCEIAKGKRWDAFEGKPDVVLREQQAELEYWASRMALRHKPTINGKPPDEGLCPVQLDTKDVKLQQRIVKEPWES